MTRKIMFATGLMFMLLNCIAQKNTKQLALIASADTEKDIIRKANKFRLRILSSRLNPTLAEIGLYKRPDMVPANIIPQPTSIVEKIGSYRINENTGIVLSTTDK